MHILCIYSIYYVRIYFLKPLSKEATIKELMVKN